MAHVTLAHRSHSNGNGSSRSARRNAVLRATATALGLVFLLGAIGGGYLWYRVEEVRPVEGAFATELERLHERPEWRKRLLEDGVAPQDVNAFLSDLARKGTHRLDDSVLVRLAGLTGRIVNAAPTAECAAIARRPLLMQLVSSPHALTSVDSSTATQYLELEFRAAAAELQHVPARQPTDSAVLDAMTIIMTRLDPPARIRLGQVFTNMAGASDADACWAARTMYDRLRGIPEPRRSVLARAILVDP